MDKNRRNKKYSNNWNNQNKNNQQNNRQNENKQHKPVFERKIYEDESVMRERQKAISEVKSREIICPKCGKQIMDIASSMADKSTGTPIHFECAFSEVEKSEKLGPNEKIAYIGQGRFGILYYENMRDQRHFTIKKIIEWEEREKKNEWREELSELYSKVN